MKILCFIDSLGSGGAQRQLLNLSLGFKEKGHMVSFLLYDKNDFYLPIIKENNIPFMVMPSSNYISRLFKCRKYIRRGGFDVVISFLKTPSLIAEFAAFPYKKWKLIVGERSSKTIKFTFRDLWVNLGYYIADYVVSNSRRSSLMIQNFNVLLCKEKVKTIYNIYDLDILNPKQILRNNSNDGLFHIVVAASHQPLKNLKNLAVAISLLDEQYKQRLVIDWYGSQEKECYQDNILTVGKLGLSEIIRFYSPTIDIYQKMIDADAVGLFSLYEGLSNCICESMCLGKPVITTDVSDNRQILNNDNLISDATSPESIAKSLVYILNLSQEELDNIGLYNRQKAKELFDKDIIVNQYLELMK